MFVNLFQCATFVCISACFFRLFLFFCRIKINIYIYSSMICIFHIFSMLKACIQPAQPLMCLLKFEKLLATDLGCHICIVFFHSVCDMGLSSCCIIFGTLYVLFHVKLADGQPVFLCEHFCRSLCPRAHWRMIHRPRKIKREKVET